MTASSRPRIDWVDAGRGLAILLVALFHATNWLDAAGLQVQFWTDLNLVISAIRLPMFFTLSGLFAGKWIQSSWHQLWSVKLSLFVWVYTLWSVIATFTFMIGMHLQGAQGNYLTQFRRTVQLLWAPRFELWFVWALALMFVLLRLLRRVPPLAQLALTGVVSVLALSFEFDWNTGWEGLAKYFFFFLLGTYARQGYFRWAEDSRAWLGWLTVLGAGGLATAGRLFGWSLTVPGYYFAVCCAGALAGIRLSVWLARLRFLAGIGRQTLPIYLTHTSLIIAVCWFVAQLPTGVKASPLWLALPPLLVAAVVPLCLAISRKVSERPIARYLYHQPEWFAARRPAVKS